MEDGWLFISRIGDRSTYRCIDLSEMAPDIEISLGDDGESWIANGKKKDGHVWLTSIRSVAILGFLDHP